MPPKKEKDQPDDNSWRLLIEQSPLNEESWQIKVIVFETAGSEQELMYLNKFESFAKEEKRFVIKNICKSETMFMVNQLGAEKKVKDENLRVFEEGHAFLKEKKDIPPDILALIIKHLILKMKDEYLSIQRQKLVVREGMRKESLTMVDPTEVKNKMPPQSAPPAVPVEPVQAKGKGKKNEAEIASVSMEPDEGKKYNTLLRLRGEEWRDKVYVDDYPLDGPNLYLAITGFLEPYLMDCLMKIDVPLTAIVQIRIDPTCNKISSGVFTQTKRGHSANELAAEKACAFWEILQELRLNETSSSVYKDMAFIVYNPPYRSSEALSNNAEHIYDELSFLMYDIQDLTRQHYHYLDNMDVKCLPTDNKDIDLYTKYCDLQDEIPLECTTVLSVLNSILNIVCIEPSVNSVTSTTSLSTALTLIQPSNSTKSSDNVEKADTLIYKVFETLSKGDFKKKKFRVSCGDEYDNYKDPVIISYGDFAKSATYHLDNVNLDTVIWSSLVNMPFCNLWQNQIFPTEELKAKVNFHVCALLSCFDRKEIDDSLLNRLIHILAFRKLYNNRSSLRKVNVPSTSISEFKKRYLKRSTFAEPLIKSSSLFWTNSATTPPSPAIVKSDSYSSDFLESSDSEIQQIEYLFDCPDLSELVSAVEIFNDKPTNHLIDDYDFFEDFSGINALQVLLDAFSKYNCLNYKYCEVTDSFVLLFFNNHDSEGVYREEWRCHLPTPVCLQDFFDFILEEQFQWINDEEKLYDECTALKTQLVWKESLDQVPRKTCLENENELDSEFLIEGSLKYQERIPPTTNNEEGDQNDSIHKTIASPATTESDAKSNQKKATPRDNKKKVKEVIPEVYLDDISDKNDYMKTFAGYNLGDRRVEVFGKDSIYFSKDGTKVYSFYTIIIPMNVEYLVLKISPGNDNNEFWMQQTLSDSVLTETPSESPCESFRILSKDQVTYYLKKNWFQILMPPTASRLSQNKESVSKMKSGKTSSMEMPAINFKSYNSFVITWPNGLVIESVNENNSPTINHIKQFYVHPATHLDEDMRCITLNGEVIIFKKSGLIDVFRPDGTFIKIIKCEKRLKSSEVPEDNQSTISSDKNKKGKGKTKSKEKIDKITSKSSKNVLDRNESITEPVYELFVDEFEITDGNGIKQTWINDHLINIEHLLIRTATDYCLGEVFSRRLDGTNQLINKDGVQVVTFHDNTRIITTYSIEEQEIYPDIEDLNDYEMNSNAMLVSEKSIKRSVTRKSIESISNNKSLSSKTSCKLEEEEKLETVVRTDGYVSVQITYTVEHANFATVVINKVDGKIIVDSPNKTSLTVDIDNNYDFLLDESTLAKFDGESLDINFIACHQCQSCTKCTVNINNMKDASYTDQTWLTMKDSFGKNVVVDDEGVISVVDELSKSETNKSKEEKLFEKASESCVLLQGKCREMYEAKAMRFFVFNRDLTCSELVHRMLVDQYKTRCRWRPWCTINQYDSFGDHRSILSVLTPLQLTVTERWLMRSKYPEKPKNLKFKDLKQDTGKGFYHWMRPYDRFHPKPTVIERIELPRLPRAYILRTLEEMWNATLRNNLKGGKEIVKAVLKYRRMMQSESQTIMEIPIKDPRSEEEKSTDQILQELAQRIYSELRNELADDIQTGARPTVTTKSSTSRPQVLMSKTGESINLLSVTCDELKKAWADTQADYAKQVEQTAKPSANLQRYWRRRAEEAKEEIFFKQLLREECIPPYFRNMLGGAVWWEVNHEVDTAVTLARSGGCKCVHPTPRQQEEESTADDEQSPSFRRKKGSVKVHTRFCGYLTSSIHLASVMDMPQTLTFGKKVLSTSNGEIEIFKCALKHLEYLEYSIEASSYFKRMSRASVIQRGTS